MRLQKALIFFGALLLCVGAAMATYSAITTVSTLTAPNDDANMASWGAAPTGSNVAYIAYDGKYQYILAFNASAVGSSPTLDIIAGTNPPAMRAGLGTRHLTISNNTPVLFGPIESARFLNASGYIQITTTNITTGKLAVLKVIRR